MSLVTCLRPGRDYAPRSIVMQGGCLEPDQVLAYVAEARVDLDATAAIEAHLDACDACRRWVAELARTSLVGDESVEDGSPIPIGEFLPRGTQVGRYVLGDRLGAGGMGAVYEATDPALGRRLAIKVLRNALADVAKRELIAEARAMARLTDPHVRAVFDIGEVGTRVFLALELVDGPTLEQWLAQRERSTADILLVFAAAARGLVAAHAIGITHRDFKPSNVFVSVDGRVLVGDFGLAAQDDQTSPGGGTPRYMAPEQREGRGDARVDQYAFGTALGEALHGRPLPRHLRGALARAVETDPARRFASMRELLAEIEPRPRRGGWVIAAAVGIVALGGLGVVASTRPVDPNEASDAEASEPIDLDVHRLDSRARALFREGDYEASREVAEQALQLAIERGNEPGRAVALLEHARALERLGRFDDAVRDAEQAYLVALAAGREDLAAEVATSRVSALVAKGAHDEAIQWGRHARAALERYDSLASERARLDMALASAHAIRGDWRNAIAVATRAIDHVRTQGARERWMLSVALSNRGHFLGQAGDFDESLRDLGEALELAIEHFGDDHVEVARVRTNLGNSFKLRGEPAKAREQYLPALRTFESHLAADDPALGVVLLNLGATWVDTGDPARALEPLRRAAEVLGPDHPDAVHAHHNLGVALRDLGRCDDSIVEAQRAIDAMTALDPDHPFLAGSVELREECIRSATAEGRSAQRP